MNEIKQKYALSDLIPCPKNYVDYGALESYKWKEQLSKSDKKIKRKFRRDIDDILVPNRKKYSRSFQEVSGLSPDTSYDSNRSFYYN